MPAITLDVSVVDGSSNKIHPNPIYPISTPFNLPAELTGAVNSPVNISSILSGQVGAPIALTPINSVDLLAPVNITEETAASIAVPADITDQARVDISAPVDIAEVAPANLSSPVNITEETSASIALPVDITEQAISAVAIPASIAELAVGPISIPSDITEESALNISLPVSIAELSAGTLSIPVDIAELSTGAIAIPADITELASGTVLAPTSIAEETPTTISAPIDITELTPATVTVPVDITEEAAANLIAPISITEQAALTLAAPVDITEIAPASLAIPTAITANALDPESPPFALNHARILYNSVLAGSATFTNNGVNPSYPLIPNTAQRWTTAVNSFIKFTMPVNNNVDTVCIGAHNLPSGGYSVQVLYRNTDGGTLTSFAASMTPTDNNAIMFHRSSAVSAKVIEVYITSGSGSAFIGSIYAGIAMQMQRPFFGGHTPTVLARQADYYGSMSESGNFIGVEVRRRSIESGADWKNLTDTWYRQYFVPFLTSAEILPFYFAWNLLQYPHDVAYCKNITNIAPSYSGQRDLMTVSIPLVGIA